MKKTLLPLIGLATACGACCAIPLLLPVLGGIAASGAGGVALGWQAGVALLAAVVAAAAAVLWLRRLNRARTGLPEVGASCGCKPSSIE